MNKFAAAGLIDALLGAPGEYDGTPSTILVISPGPASSAAAFDEVARHAGHALRVVHAAGRCAIEHGPRRIDFRTVRSNLRGMSADIVFIDEEADRVLEGSTGDHREFAETVRAIIATSPRGEIVRA